MIASAGGEPQRENQREPQQDRSRATRQRLLESTIELLAQRGWAGTTVAEVAEHAGVSRGAAQHHYRTREDLITGALEYMFDKRMTEVRSGSHSLPPGGPERTRAVVGRMVEHFTGALFKAALQVWTAAAADDDLRGRIVPLEARFGRHAHRATVEMLDADDSDPTVHRLVQATLDLARGLGLADVLTDDSDRRDRIIRQWSATLDSVISADAPAGATGAWGACEAVSPSSSSSHAVRGSR